MTIKFHGGPAGGRSLMLRRAPALLRVVLSKSGELDALDQTGDEPAIGETVSVYKIREPATRVHIRAQRPAPSGCFMFGEYDCLIAAPDPGDCVGASWVLLAEELAAIHFPDLLPADVLAAARERLVYGFRYPAADPRSKPE